jgi:hypothetical protein
MADKSDDNMGPRMKRMQSEDPQYYFRKLFEFYEKEFRQAAENDTFTGEERACMAQHVKTAKHNSNVNAFAGGLGTLGVSYLVPQLRKNMWLRVPFVVGGTTLAVVVGVSQGTMDTTRTWLFYVHQMSCTFERFNNTHDTLVRSMHTTP